MNWHNYGHGKDKPKNPYINFLITSWLLIAVFAIILEVVKNMPKIINVIYANYFENFSCADYKVIKHQKHYV